MQTENNPLYVKDPNFLKLADKYNAFFQNPTISVLATHPHWSVSDPNDKHPLNIPYFFQALDAPDKGYQLEVDGRGASFMRPETMMTPDDILNGFIDRFSECLPYNLAYYFSTDCDNVCCIDIEPTCPNDIKEQFLHCNFLYGETSMSGKGYHLLIPIPTALLEKYPNAQNKTKLQHKQKYFEVHFEHWLTFTANQIQLKGNNDITPLIEPLFSEARADTGEYTVDLSDELSDHYELVEEALFDDMIMHANKYCQYQNRGDDSAYEFLVAMWFCRTLDYFMEEKQKLVMITTLTDQECISLIHDLMFEFLPYRPKFDQHFIQGVPYLFHTAKNAYISHRKEHPKPWIVNKSYQAS